MKKVAVMMTFLFIGLIISTGISSNGLEEKEVKPVAKERVNQISSPLRGKDEPSRMSSPIPQGKR